MLRFSLVLTGSVGLVTGENEVKQGSFPYMALVYYLDDSKLENGRRFMRSAVLIQPQWLVSSTLEVHGDMTFPHKTLLARVGAVVVDSNFTLNDEEFEQDREIIQVVQPAEIDTEQFWYYNISLLKTLEPFKVTPYVRPADVFSTREFVDKNCYILIYGLQSTNTSAVQLLRLLPVHIETPEVCGSYYKNDTMICSNYDHDVFAYDPDSCVRNSGGPLLCNNDVAGIQTYVSECREPQLYLLLNAWKEFINCSVEEKCQAESCLHTCIAIDKDEPGITAYLETPKPSAPEPERRLAPMESQVAKEINDTSTTAINFPNVTSEASTTEGDDPFAISTAMSVPTATTGPLDNGTSDHSKGENYEDISAEPKHVNTADANTIKLINFLLFPILTFFV